MLSSSLLLNVCSQSMNEIKQWHEEQQKKKHQQMIHEKKRITAEKILNGRNQLECKTKKIIKIRNKQATVLSCEKSQKLLFIVNYTI